MTSAASVEYAMRHGLLIDGRNRLDEKSRADVRQTSVCRRL